MNELPKAVVPGSSRLANHENEAYKKRYSARSEQQDTSRFWYKQGRDNGQNSEEHNPHP